MTLDSVTKKETANKATIKGIFSRQSTGETRSSRGGIEKQNSSVDLDVKRSRSGTTKSDAAKCDEHKRKEVKFELKLVVKSEIFYVIRHTG